MISHQSTQHNSCNTPTDNKQKGFGQLLNMILDYLCDRKKCDLTAREYTIVLFIIRETIHWNYELRPFEIEEIADRTGIHVSHISECLASLVNDHKVLIKRKLVGVKTPLYGLNPEIFGGQILANPNTRRVWFQWGRKWINLVDLKLEKSNIKLANLDSFEKSDSDSVSSTKTDKDEAPRGAPVVNSRVSKDPKTHINTPRGRSQILTYEIVEEKLLKSYPNDADRIRGAYKQMKQNGHEREGQAPYYPGHLLSYFLSKYASFRQDYAHHDRKFKSKAS